MCSCGGMLTELVESARRARRRLDAALIASHDRLSVPFTDRPELSPWTRSVKPSRDALAVAVDALVAEMERVRDELRDYADLCAEHASTDVARADVAWKLRAILDA